MQRLMGNSPNLAATCDGHKAVVAASNAFPLRDYFNLAAVAVEAEGGGACVLEATMAATN